MLSHLDIILCALGGVLTLSLFLLYTPTPIQPGRDRSGTGSFAGVLVTAEVIEDDGRTGGEGVVFEVNGIPWTGTTPQGWGVARSDMASLVWNDANTWPRHVHLCNRNSTRPVRCRVVVCTPGDVRSEEVTVPPGLVQLIPSEVRTP